MHLRLKTAPILQVSYVKSISCAGPTRNQRNQAEPDRSQGKAVGWGHGSRTEGQCESAGLPTEPYHYARATFPDYDNDESAQTVDPR